MSASTTDGDSTTGGDSTASGPSGRTRPVDVAAADTLLFVPGDRPERFAKAAAAGADVIILDLEDAVDPAAKDRARAAVVQWLAAGNPGIVRVNAVGTPWHDADLEAVGPLAGVVFLPKAESASEVAHVVSRLQPGAGVVLLVETAAGVLRAAEIATVEGVVRLAFGNFDLSTQLGLDPADWEALAPMRAGLVLASAAAGLPSPVDGVTASVSDAGRITDDTRHALRVGYGAKLCIHPVQVGIAAAALAPRPEEVEWAQRVVAADEAAEHGAVTLDGAMVDKPVVDRARRIIARQVGKES